MALIKCPECGKKMSDKAESCPHCGYSKTFKKNNNITENLKGKLNNKYLVLVLVVLLIGAYFIFFNKSKDNNQGTGSNPQVELKPNANGNYEFNQNGKYFEFPTSYKVYVEKDGTIYVGQNIDDKGALIPYIMIEKYKNYSDPRVLLSDLTTEIGKNYPDVTITIDLISSYVGDKYVYGMQFSYTSDGHLVVDNRYAFLIDNNMYLVTTKEENVNTTEINNVTSLIMKTLKEVN